MWYLFSTVFGDTPQESIHSLTQDYSSVSHGTKNRSPDTSRSKNGQAKTTAPIKREKFVIPVTDNSHNSGTTALEIPLCHKPSGLGPIQANMSNMVLEEVEKKYPEVRLGGWYLPPNCTAGHKVAVIVPYRDRKKNLAVFLNHMHPFLMKQQLEYQIFVVEQQGTHEFNRGKLLNVGFVESQQRKAGGWQCFIFHDIDMLPLDTRNMYSCPRPHYPRFTLASKTDLGGVTAVTVEQFTVANGFSNGYWGWGGEDNDLFYRFTNQGYLIEQYQMPVARYASLPHNQPSLNPRRYQLLLQTMKSSDRDGLFNLQYNLVSVTLHHLHTHMVVNVDQSFHDLQDLFNEQDNLQQLPV